MIPQQLIVIADAHLAAAPSDNEEAFLALLDHLPSLGDGLLLAGDIYDFWFTYRHLIPRRNFRVTAALASLARQMPVMMIGGNHDRWGGTFWESETSLRFHPDQLRFEAAGRDILAIHGDGLHESRSKDRILNRLIRSRFVIGTFRRIPSDFGFGLGHALGHDGRHPGKPEHLRIAAEGQLAWARTCLATSDAPQTLVMGHTHVPALQELTPGHWYLNPGPWLGEQRYAVIEQAGIRLEQFS